MKNYLKLLRFLKGHEKIFGWAIAAMLVSNLFNMFQLSMIIPLFDRMFKNEQIIIPNKLPAFVMHIIGNLNSLSPEALFRLLPFVIFIGIVLKNIFIYVYGFLTNDVSQRIIRDMRQRLYDKIQSLSLDYFSKKRTGELMSRITNDVTVIENAVSYGIQDLFVQTFAVVGFLIMAFTIYFQAAVIIFLVFPLIIWPISIIGKKLRKLSRQSQERMADITSILLETISGVRVVKAFCTEQYEMDRFRLKNRECYKLKMKSVRRLLLLSPITEIFGTVCGIVMILWLGEKVMHHQLSLGVFIFFFATIMSVISPLKKLGNVHAMTQQALAANDRIYEILDKKPTVVEKSDALNIPIMQEGIRIDGVTFRYDDESGDVLHDINLEIRAGELVAIVGPTGSGKSTLVNLVPRFYDPSQGRVTIDSVNLRAVSFRSLRLQIGIVSQETFLFNDTVRNNIAYGTLHATQKEIEEAAQRAFAHQFVIDMPQSYETIIGDRGFRLSGGEKQRIAIARAILKNPPILILDEATSQLDSESEKFVQDALDKLMQGRTVIAIAHRLSTIKKADKIVVVEQGRIVGMGKHQELLVTCDLYRRLYETQFQM